MPDLIFSTTHVESVSEAASPEIAIHVQIVNRVPLEAIESVALRCQVQIETPRRRYSHEEQLRLDPLFGTPERWGQTLRPMLWTNLAITVPGFLGEASVCLTIPCTPDLRLAPTKYFHSLDGGTVPITLLFSGTAFYATPDRRLQIAPISWDREARFAFPVDIWKQAVRHALEVGA